MNYYEHHLADYTQATAHLSFVEDAAYSRMLRWYYANEKPLPADIKKIERLVRAHSEEEREAVKTILDEFFFEESDGWHQDRTDQEIARYQDKQRKATASANARWSKQKSQCEVNTDVMPTHIQTQYEGNAPQTPDPIHQTPSSINKTHTIPENEVGGLTAGSVCVFFREQGIIRTNPSHPDLLAALGGGATKSDFEFAVTEAKNKNVSDGFSYALKIVLGNLENRKNAKPNVKKNAPSYANSGFAEKYGGLFAAKSECGGVDASGGGAEQAGGGAVGVGAG